MSSDEEGGTLTPEIINRSLDDLWNMPRREPEFPPEWLLLRAAEDALRPCKATLFAPDESLVEAIKAGLIITGTPVHPLEAAWLNARVQGPAPLACAREPHPESPWHWDGCGTWWR